MNEYQFNLDKQQYNLSKSKSFAAKIGILNEQFKNYNNSRTYISGKSWDAKHLDNFLHLSPFGNKYNYKETQICKQQFNQFEKQEEPQMYEHPLLKNKQQILRKNNNLFSNQSQILTSPIQENKLLNKLLKELNDSHLQKQQQQKNEIILKKCKENKFLINTKQEKSILSQIVKLSKNNSKISSNLFSGPPRFNEGSIYHAQDDVNKNPSYNQFNIMNYSEQKNQTPSKKIQKESDYQYYINNKKIIPISALSYCQFSNFSNIREQLKEIKQKQQEFFKQKLKRMQQQKKYRIIKNQYKSGILNIDSPFKEDSILYKEEHSLLELKEKKHELFQKFRNQKNQIFKISKNIMFYNDNGENQNSDLKEYIHYDLKGNRLPRRHQMKRNHFQNSFENLFQNQNSEHYSLDRMEFLRKQDVRKKSFNILSNYQLKNYL